MPKCTAQAATGRPLKARQHTILPPPPASANAGTIPLPANPESPLCGVSDPNFSRTLQLRTP